MVWGNQKRFGNSSCMILQDFFEKKILVFSFFKKFNLYFDSVIKIVSKWSHRVFYLSLPYKINIYEYDFLPLVFIL